jgi:hypothetical protein
MKAVLHETNLTQEVPLPKIKSSVQTTDILPKTDGDAVFESPGIAVTSDDDVAGSVNKGDLQEFARKSFGTIATPYLSPFVHRIGILDVEYGLRKIGNRFLLVIPM